MKEKNTYPEIEIIVFETRDNILLSEVESTNTGNQGTEMIPVP